MLVLGGVGDNFGAGRGVMGGWTRDFWDLTRNLRNLQKEPENDGFQTGISFSRDFFFRFHLTFLGCMVFDAGSGSN